MIIGYYGLLHQITESENSLRLQFYASEDDIIRPLIVEFEDLLVGLWYETVCSSPPMFSSNDRVVSHSVRN